MRNNCEIEHFLDGEVLCVLLDVYFDEFFDFDYN